MTTDSKLASRVNHHVHIIGTGLLGASIGLGLREHGTEVTLEDISPTALDLAIDYGAGRRLTPDDKPALVIIATPPDVVGEVIAQALERFPEAYVTDVTSVKLAPYRQLLDRGINLDRYVGSHPMAGRERGSAVMARADMFVGRPWVICRDAKTPAAALAAVESVALQLGATPTEWDPAQHDQAVALVSHVPQLTASLLAAQLNRAAEQHIALAGGGIRDTTRIADSDPQLWVQILGANSEAVAAILRQLRSDLDDAITALSDTDAQGAKKTIAALLTAGNAGVRRLPGKHGSAARFTSFTVIVDDTPGQLARLLTDLGELQINMEDLRLEHSPGAQIGFAEVSVLPEVTASAVNGLQELGWRILDWSRDEQ